MVKRLFRWAFRLLVLVIVLAVAGLLLLDTIVRELAEYRIGKDTGLEVRISKMQVGILNPWVRIEKLLIYNSAEFGGSPLVEVPEVRLEYDRGSLWSKKLHFKLVRLNFAQLNVVEDKRGRLNLEELQKRFVKKGGAQNSTNKSPQRYEAAGIDTLNLTLGQASFTSFKEPGHNEILKMDVQNQVLLNVKSWNDLGGVFTYLMLKNNINVVSKGAPRPDDPWQYWTERLGIEKK
jgi:uncharacterized protein involved in outer membrane biogenesis